MTIKKTLLFLFILLLTACNKDRKYSEWFNHRTWKATELSVNGNQLINILPKIEVHGADIYKDVGKATWSIGFSDYNRLFYWQFSEKGKKITISRIAYEPTSLEELLAVDKDVYDYSGTYNVKSAKRDKMIFESTNTIGYPGKIVRIILKN